MNELTIGNLAFGGTFGVSLGCWFYMWGGRGGKWKRRFIGSFILSASVIGLFSYMGKFTFPVLFLYPLTIGAFHLWYGSDIFWEKIRKRTAVVAASLLSGALLAIISGGWAIFPVEAVIASVSIYIGVKNPIQAASEEYFICMFLWMPKLMYAFV